jgi:aspartyl-tRNA(Asn)/glutamyl-tRNA(Gln) amidotransferase subunit B
MEEGSLRCDANVSVRLKGAEKFGQKTEVKNLNSFRNVKLAIEAEIERQIGLVESGEKVLHQTMLFDANKGVTRPMRTKEEAHDYRYFPEPDLLPVTITKEYLEEVHKELPEMQRARRGRFISDFGLPKYDADVLTADKAIADFFEEVIANLVTRSNDLVKSISNYLMGDVMRMLSEKKVSIDKLGLEPKHLADLVSLVGDKTISNKIAKDLLPELIGSKKSPNEIVAERGISQVSDEGELREAVKNVLANNSDNIAKYKSGKTNLFGFFVGQAMKALGGKANPTILNEVVKEELEKV